MAHVVNCYIKLIERMEKGLEYGSRVGGLTEPSLHATIHNCSYASVEACARHQQERFTVGEASLNWNNAPLDKYPRDFLRIGLDAGFMREDVTSSSRDDSDRNIGPLRPCCNLSDRAIASDCNDSIE
jgi:hypothetical protein